MNRNALRYLLARPYAPLVRLASQTSGFRMLIFHDVSVDEVRSLDALLFSLRRQRRLIAPRDAEEMLDRNMTSESSGQARNGVVLTFDDGFKSNLSVAREVLDAHGVHALFFVCPGLIDAPPEERTRLVETFVFPGDVPRPPADRLTVMNWDDIRELKKRGHTIGSHSMLHRKLSVLSSDALEQDVRQSFTRLNDEIGEPPKWFAFPFGDLASVSAAVLAQVGCVFEFVCSGVRGANTRDTNRLALRRESIDLNAPPQYQRMVADGGLDLLYRSRSRRLDALAGDTVQNRI